MILENFNTANGTSSSGDIQAALFRYRVSSMDSRELKHARNVLARE